MKGIRCLSRGWWTEMNCNPLRRGTSWSSHSQGVRTTKDHLCYQAIGPKPWQLGQGSNRIYHTCNHPSTPHTWYCLFMDLDLYKTPQPSRNTGELMPNFPGKPLVQKILKTPKFQGNLCPNFQWDCTKIYKWSGIEHYSILPIYPPSHIC